MLGRIIFLAALAAAVYYYYYVAPKAKAAGGVAPPAAVAPVSGAPAAAAAAPTSVRARYLRVQSTRQPPVVDGVVELKDAGAMFQGTPHRFTAGVLSPPSGDPNMRWDLMGEETSPTGGMIGTSGSTTGNQYIQFDLGAMRDVDRVGIKIRLDEPWRQRCRNYTLFLIDDANKNVWQRAIGDVAQPHFTFSVP